MVNTDLEPCSTNSISKRNIILTLFYNKVIHPLTFCEEIVYSDLSVCGAYHCLGKINTSYTY